MRWVSSGFNSIYETKRFAIRPVDLIRYQVKGGTSRLCDILEPTEVSGRILHHFKSRRKDSTTKPLTSKKFLCYWQNRTVEEKRESCMKRYVFYQFVSVIIALAAGLYIALCHFLWRCQVIIFIGFWKIVHLNSSDFQWDKETADFK